MNQFWANAPFLYPLKKSENNSFSDVFRGHRNWILGLNGLIFVQVFSAKQCIALPIIFVTINSQKVEQTWAWIAVKYKFQWVGHFHLLKVIKVIKVK